MDATGINNLLAHMREAMAIAQGGVSPAGAASGKAAPAPATDFASVLKSSLDGVAAAQNKSESMQHAFVLGDPSVSLSDVVIDMQKANISLQTAIQVRNKVVTAYNDIMNMQV